MYNKFLALFLVVSTVLSFVYLAHYQRNDDDDYRLRIVCTTTMVADAVRQLCGDDVLVVSLMGPGVDPHLYRAKEGDIHRLAEADVIVYQGLHLEGKMVEALAAMHEYTNVIVATASLNENSLLSSEFDDMYDPHVWHDVCLWKQAVTYLAEQLSTIDTTYAHMYHNNLNVYLRELTVLDNEIREQLALLPNDARVLVTAHDAFAYFGRAYGIEVVALQGLSTESDIGIKDIQNVANYIVDNQITAIFLETSIAPRSMYALHQAVTSKGWQVIIGPELYSDALGEQSEASGTYCGMMRSNISRIFATLYDAYHIGNK